MKKIKERLLSLLLTVCMVIGLMPALTVGAAAWAPSGYESFSSRGTKTVTSGSPGVFTVNSSGTYNILSNGNPSDKPIFVAVMDKGAGSGTYEYNVVITGGTSAPVDGYTYASDISTLKGLQGNICIIGNEVVNPVTVNVYFVGSVSSCSIKLGALQADKKLAPNPMRVQYTEVNGGQADFGDYKVTLNIIETYANSDYGARIQTGATSGLGNIQIYETKYTGTVTTNNSDAKIKVDDANITINAATPHEIFGIPENNTRAVTAETYIGSNDFVNVGTIMKSNPTVAVNYYPVTFSGGTNGGDVRAFLGNSSSGTQLTPSPKSVLNGQRVYFDAERFAGSGTYVDYVSAETVGSSGVDISVPYHQVTFGGKGTGGTGNYGQVNATCNNQNVANNTYVLKGQTVNFSAETYYNSGIFRNQTPINVNDRDETNNIQYYSVNYQAVYGAGTGTGSLGTVKAYWENGSNDIIIPTSGTNVLAGENVYVKAETYAGSTSFVNYGVEQTVGSSGVNVGVPYHTVTFGAANSSGAYGTVTATRGTSITSGTNVLQGQTVTFTATPSTTRTSYIQSINDSGFDIDNLKGATWNNVTVDAAKDYSVTFGNWEAELGAELTADGADKAGVLYKYLDGTDTPPTTTTAPF